MTCSVTPTPGWGTRDSSPFGRAEAVPAAGSALRRGLPLHNSPLPAFPPPRLPPAISPLCPQPRLCPSMLPPPRCRLPGLCTPQHSLPGLCLPPPPQVRPPPMLCSRSPHLLMPHCPRNAPQALPPTHPDPCPPLPPDVSLGGHPEALHPLTPPLTPGGVSAPRRRRAPASVMPAPRLHGDGKHCPQAHWWRRLRVHAPYWRRAWRWRSPEGGGGGGGAGTRGRMWMVGASGRGHGKKGRGQGKWAWPGQEQGAAHGRDRCGHHPPPRVRVPHPSCVVPRAGVAPEALGVGTPVGTAGPCWAGGRDVPCPGDTPLQVTPLAV